MTNTITCTGVRNANDQCAFSHLNSQFLFTFNAEFDKILQGILKIFIPRPKFDKFSLNPKGLCSLKQATSPVLWGPTKHKPASFTLSGTKS